MRSYYYCIFKSVPSRYMCLFSEVYKLKMDRILNERTPSESLYLQIYFIEVSRTEEKSTFVIFKSFISR